MLINNPTYTLRLIDLVDTYKYPFDFSEIYSKVGDMLEPIRDSFYTTDKTEWNKFIKRFCRRFYNRNLNFDTYLDFTLKLQDVLDSKRMIADRYVILNAKNINPWSTYGTDKTTSGKADKTLKSTTENESESHGTSENTGTNTSNGYHLHTDTPSSSVNVSSLFNTTSNYITDADNTKADDTTKSQSKNNVSGSSLTDNMTTQNDTNLYKEIAEGYQGNPLELLAKLDTLTSDVIEKYLLWIEEEHLFSSILY